MKSCYPIPATSWSVDVLTLPGYRGRFENTAGRDRRPNRPRLLFRPSAAMLASVENSVNNLRHSVTNMTALCLRRIVIFGLFGILLATLSLGTGIDLDVFHELALIREAIALARLPTWDVFAYTPTVDPVVHHEWGTGAVLYLVTVWSGFGATGLMVLRYLLCLFIAGGAYVCARRRGATEPVLSFLALVALMLLRIGFTTIRAQVFTLALLVVLMLCLTADSKGRRWWLPLWLVLYAAWVNLHAGFLVGFGLWGLYTVERFCREFLDTRSVSRAFRRVVYLIGGLAGMSLLILANPYGTDYVRYLWRAVLMPRPTVPEWQPLWQSGPWPLQLFFLISLAIAIYAVTRRGVGHAEGILLVGITAWLALQHTRHVTLYGVVWLCLVPAWIETTALGTAMHALWHRRAAFLATVWFLCGVIGFGHAWQERFWELQVPTAPPPATTIKESFPAGAVQYLAETGFQGNLMVTFQTGAFVSWKLYPAVRVSIDSRYEVAYPAQWREEVAGFYRAEGDWQATLIKHPTDAVLVPFSRPVAALLDDAPSHTGDVGWQEIYRDDAYSIFMRQALAANHPKLDRRGETIVGTFP